MTENELFDHVRSWHNVGHSRIEDYQGMIFAVHREYHEDLEAVFVNHHHSTSGDVILLREEI